MVDFTEQEYTDILSFLARIEASVINNNDDNTVYSSAFEDESVSGVDSIKTSQDDEYDKLLKQRKEALRAKIDKDTLKYCLELIQDEQLIDNELLARNNATIKRNKELKYIKKSDDDLQTVNTIETEVISEGDSPLVYDAALKFLFQHNVNTLFLNQALETGSARSLSRSSSAISRDSRSIMTSRSDFSSDDTNKGDEMFLNLTNQVPNQQSNNSDDYVETGYSPLSTARTIESKASTLSGLSYMSKESRGSFQPVLFNSLMSIGQPDTTLLRGVAVKFADGEYRLFPKTAEKGSKRVTFKKREDITNSKHCYSYKPRSEEAEYAKYFLKYFFSKHYERLQRVLTNEDFVNYTSEVIKDIHEGLPLTLNDVNLTLYSHLCFFIKYNWTDDITRYDLVMMMIYFQVKSFFYNGEPAVQTTADGKEWECKSKNCWEKAIVDVASVLNSSPNFEKDKLIDQITYIIKKNCPHVREDRYLSRLVSTILSTYFFYYMNNGQELLGDGATVRISTSALTRFTGQTGATRLTDQTGQTQLTETSMGGQLMRAAIKMVEDRNKKNPVSIDNDPFDILDDLSVQTFATPQYYTKGEDKNIDYLRKLLQEKESGKVGDAEADINYELINSRMNIRTFKALKLLSTADLLRADVINYILDKSEIDERETQILKSFFNDIVKDGDKYDRLLYPQLLRKLKNAIDDGRLKLDDYKNIFKKYWEKYQVYIFGTKYLTLTALEEKKRDGNTTMDETLNTVATNEEIFYMMYDYIYYNCPKKLKEDEGFLKDFFAGEPKEGEESKRPEYWTTPETGYPPSNINDEFPALINDTTATKPESIIDHYIKQGFLGDENINLYKIPSDDRKIIVEDIMNNINGFTYGKEVQEHWNKLYKFVKFKSAAAKSARGLLTRGDTSSVGGNINKSKAFFSTRKDHRPFPKKIPTKNKKRVTFKNI